MELAVCSSNLGFTTCAISASGVPDRMQRWDQLLCTTQNLFDKKTQRRVVPERNCHVDIGSKLAFPVRCCTNTTVVARRVVDGCGRDQGCWERRQLSDAQVGDFLVNNATATRLFFATVGSSGWSSSELE